MNEYHQKTGDPIKVIQFFNISNPFHHCSYSPKKRMRNKISHLQESGHSVFLSYHRTAFDFTRREKKPPRSLQNGSRLKTRGFSVRTKKSFAAVHQFSVCVSRTAIFSAFPVTSQRRGPHPAGRKNRFPYCSRT